MCKPTKGLWFFLVKKNYLNRLYEACLPTIFLCLSYFKLISSLIAMTFFFGQSTEVGEIFPEKKKSRQKCKYVSEKNG